MVGSEKSDKCGVEVKLLREINSISWPEKLSFSYYIPPA